MATAGWYNDERDPTLARWHDGTRWTSDTIVKAEWRGRTPPPPAAPPLAPAPAPAPRSSASGRGGALDRLRALLSRERRTAIAIVVVLAVAVVARLLASVFGGDDSAATSAATTKAPTYGTDFSTPDGQYRITVTPGTGSTAASPHGCVVAAAAGRTNLRFTIRIDNLSTHPAPVPVVGAGANVGTNGLPSPRVLRFEDAVADRVELGSLADGAACPTSRTSPSGGTIGAGHHVTLDGVVGNVLAPVPVGFALIIRYPQQDPTAAARSVGADLLAPFPAGTAAR